MSVNMRVQAMPAQAFLGLGIGGVAVLAFVPQIAAITVTMQVGGTEKPALGLLGMLRLWGTTTPTELTGAKGLDLLHWGSVAGCLLLIVAVVTGFAVAFSLRAKNPQYKRGLATVSDVTKELGTKQLLQKRAPLLRPSLKHPKPTDVGFYAGQFLGSDMWLRAEDPTIIIGGSGSGKGVNFVLP